MCFFKLYQKRSGECYSRRALSIGFVREGMFRIFDVTDERFKYWVLANANDINPCV